MHIAQWWLLILIPIMQSSCQRRNLRPQQNTRTFNCKKVLCRIVDFAIFSCLHFQQDEKRRRRGGFGPFGKCKLYGGRKINVVVNEDGGGSDDNAKENWKVERDFWARPDEMNFALWTIYGTHARIVGSNIQRDMGCGWALSKGRPHTHTHTHAPTRTKSCIIATS